MAVRRPACVEEGRYIPGVCDAAVFVPESGDESRHPASILKRIAGSGRRRGATARRIMQSEPISKALSHFVAASEILDIGFWLFFSPVVVVVVIGVNRLSFLRIVIFFSLFFAHLRLRTRVDVVGNMK